MEGDGLQQCLESSHSFTEAAAAFSSGAEELHAEILSMEAILKGLDDAFRGPSITETMDQSSHAQRAVVPAGSEQGTCSQESTFEESTFKRRASAAGRKPGSELLWPGQQKSLLPMEQPSAEQSENLDPQAAASSKPRPHMSARTSKSAAQSGGANEAMIPETAAQVEADSEVQTDHGTDPIGRGCPRTPAQTLGRSETQNTPSAPHAELAGEAEELAEYLAHKEDLAAAVRKFGSEHLRARSEGMPAGLRNQGATCYLNSLLQHLFHTKEIRQFIYTWQYDASAHGPAERCIPLALQRLFARLQCSSSAAVGTEELTKAFGWDRAQSFAQHDISELMRVLFEALGLATRGFSKVEDMYRGKLLSYITAPVRGVSRHRDEPFLDLQLDVSGYASVEDALRAYLSPEELTGDNQWHLDDGSKVDALKGLALASAPRLLTLALKRFTFDMETLRRVKVNDVLEVPLELDVPAIIASQTIPTTAGGGGGGGDGGGGGEQYPLSATKAEALDAPLPPHELVAIFIHSGTATGGHYRAFLRVADHDLSAGGVNHKRSEGGGHDTTAGPLSRARASPTGHWYSFNDAQVLRVGDGDGAWGPISDMLLEASGLNVAEAPSRTPRAAGNTSAYMLVYRRREVESGENDEGDEGVDGCAKEEESAGKCQRLKEAQVPESCQAMVRAENEHLLQLQRLADIQQRVVTVRAWGCMAPEAGVVGRVDEDKEVVLHILESQSLAALTTQVADALCLPTGTDVSRGEEAARRLRRYNRYKAVGEETFGGREHMSLKALGLGPTCSVLLETAPPLHKFVEWSPHDMSIRLVFVPPDFELPPHTRSQVWLEALPSQRIVVSEKSPLADLVARAAKHRPSSLSYASASAASSGLCPDLAPNCPDCNLILLARRSAGGLGQGDILQPSRMLECGRKGGGEEAEMSIGEGGLGLQHGDVVLVELLAGRGGEGEGEQRPVVGKEEEEHEGGGGRCASRVLQRLLDSENLAKMTCHAPKAILRELLDAGGGLRVADASENPEGKEEKSKEEGDAVASVELDLRWPLERAKRAVMEALALGMVQGLREEGACKRDAKGAHQAVHTQGGEAQSAIGGTVEELLLRVHVRKTSKGAQLKDKDEKQALSELGFVGGSLLFIRSGAPRSENQKTIKVFLAQTASAVARPLLALTIEQTWTVAELKSALAVRLSKSKDKAVAAAAAKGSWPQGVPPTQVLRLRQKKGALGGSLLKDDTPLIQALPRLADDTPVVLQLLEQPEAADDGHSILVLVQRWCVDQGAERLNEPCELRVPRAANGRALAALLSDWYSSSCPSESCSQDTMTSSRPISLSDPAAARDGKDEIHGGGEEAHDHRDALDGSHVSGASEAKNTDSKSGMIAFAKLPSFGPAVTHLRGTKLTWLSQSSQSDADGHLNLPVTSPPLGLRDSNLIVVVREDEWRQFVDAAGSADLPPKQQQAQDASSSSLRRARARADSSRSARDRGPVREAQLQILVHADVCLEKPGAGCDKEGDGAPRSDALSEGSYTNGNPEGDEQVQQA